MANAQILVLVRSTAPVAADAIRTIVEAAARAAGFTPGPWTFDTQAVHAVPATNGGGGVVVGGAWNGDPVGEAVPAAGATLVFNAYRQNLMNGPDPTPAQRVSGGWPMETAPVGALLRALPGVTSTRLAFRAPSNSISWDRGVPSPIALSDAGTSTPTGIFVGIAIVGIAAYAYARSSEKMRSAPSLGNCPELRRVEQQEMARARRGGLGGLGGVDRSHLLVVEGPAIGTQVVEAFDSERAASAAAKDLRVFRDALGAKASVRVAHKLRGSGRVRRMQRAEVLQLLKRTVA